MIESNIKTVTWIVGAIALIAIALLFAVAHRGKVRSVVYEKSRWLFVCCNLLLGLDMAIHFVSHHHETNPTICYAINLVLLLLIMPLYCIALINLLKEAKKETGQYSKTDSKPQDLISQDLKPQDLILPEPEEMQASELQDLTTSEPEDIQTSEPKDIQNTEPETAPTFEPQILKWVSERHFTDPELTIDKALKQMGLSSASLHYYLEKRTKAGSFRKWLTYLRIEEAKRLLILNPNHTIQAAAETCGYANNQSFAKAFKAQEGVSPSEWISNNKHNIIS